jgi:hypothetical protein
VGLADLDRGLYIPDAVRIGDCWLRSTGAGSDVREAEELC